MSGSGTNHWKLGVFVVATATLGLGTLFWVGAQRFNKETVERVTYFEESVQGLDLGAPVKVRGVPIGTVASIRIAPDGKLVEVKARIEADELRRLGIPEASLTSMSDADLAGDSQLRLFLSTTGITGVKFIEADFVAPTTPTPRISFTPPRNFIPSGPSTLASLEGAARGIGEELPRTLAAARDLALTLEARVAAIDTPALNARIVRLLDGGERLLASADQVVGHLGPSGEDLVSQVGGLVQDGREAAAGLRALIDRLGTGDGPVERAASSLVSLANDAGTLVDAARDMLNGAGLSDTTAAIRGTTASVTDAAASFQTLARDLQPAATDLRETLGDLRAALRRIEELAAYLERDPGSLLRGRPEGGR
ncbi:MAG: MlaD family protein [Planctomycetota bacterium]